MNSSRHLYFRILEMKSKWENEFLDYMDKLEGDEE
jgi:hypothetical protein